MSREVDYYSLLGVARDASEAEIRERFRTLAREAHPDRAPAARKAQAESKFQELTEAVNVLTSPDRRKAYDFDLAAAKNAPEVGGDAVAANYVNQGIAAYKERKFTEAAGNFQLAAGRNPKDVKAQHYLGLASARAGDMRTAVKAIEAALTIEPHNGGLLKDAGAIFPASGSPAEGREGVSGGRAVGPLGRRRAEGSRRGSRAAGRQGIRGSRPR
jgi:DnaJ-class molecular chaperone